MVNGFLAALFITCVFGTAISAQAPSATPSPTPSLSVDDILITVNLTAKELKFDVVPNPKVEFPGTDDRIKVWITDRQNLPEKVEPGVTYRNIGIQLRIASRFADIEQIVREALGEVPAAVTTEPPAKTQAATSATVPKPKERKRR